jgi:integrase
MAKLKQAELERMLKDGGAMKPIVALTYPELMALLGTAQRQGDVRAHILFLLGVAHGLRVSEVVNLTTDQFSVTGGKTFLKTARLKHSNETCQELMVHAEPLLDEQALVTSYISKLRSKRLFNLTRFGAHFLIQRYGLWAGLPEYKRHMHVLKHTLGTWMRQKGSDLIEIQNALGHANVNSTMAYLRPTSDEIEQARTAAFTYSHAPAPPVPEIGLRVVRMSASRALGSQAQLSPVQTLPSRSRRQNCQNII